MFRRRHVVEMITMAQRPFSNVILDSTIENVLESQAQKTLTKTKPPTNKKDINVCPIAIEMTSNNQAAVSDVICLYFLSVFYNRISFSISQVCTVFVRLPQQSSTASGYKQPVCFGSSLIIQPKNNIFLIKPPARISQQNV